MLYLEAKKMFNSEDARKEDQRLSQELGKLPAMDIQAVKNLTGGYILCMHLLHNEPNKALIGGSGSMF